MKMTVEELVREVKRGIFVKLRSPFGLSEKEAGHVWRVGFAYYEVEGNTDEIRKAVRKAKKEGMKKGVVTGLGALFG